MAHHPIINPPVPCVYPIPGGVYPGLMVRVRGTPFPNAMRFAINLQCGPRTEPRDDIALHLNVWFDRDTVVRNTLTSMMWGREESGYYRIARGHPFEVLILIEHTNMKIAFNGAHFCDYVHRIPFQRITHLTIDGEVTIQHIGFEAVPLRHPQGHAQPAQQGHYGPPQHPQHYGHGPPGHYGPPGHHGPPGQYGPPPNRGGVGTGTAAGIGAGALLAGGLGGYALGGGFNRGGGGGGGGGGRDGAPQNPDVANVTPPTLPGGTPGGAPQNPDVANVTPPTLPSGGDPGGTPGSAPGATPDATQPAVGGGGPTEPTPTADYDNFDDFGDYGGDYGDYDFD